MACGGCGARRSARAGTAEEGTITKYRITWGDGTTELKDTFPQAKLAMGTQSDPVKRKGMRYLSVAVKV